jgi:hypothetical protein
LYRCLVEDFLIQYCQDLKVGDFVVKSEWASGKKDRKGKRQHLSDTKTIDRSVLALLLVLWKIQDITVDNHLKKENRVNEIDRSTLCCILHKGETSDL